jgi:PAS domain S-box-containing protein
MLRTVFPMPAADYGDILGPLLEASPFAVIGIDPNGDVRVWNRAAEEMFGWQENEVISRRSPVDLQLPLKPGDPVELRLTKRSGAAIDVELRTAAWKDSGGNPKGTLVILANVSRLRAAERELATMMTQASEAQTIARADRRFRELLEAAPDAIIEVDRGGRIVLLNIVTEKLFGYTREELLDRPLEILIPEELRGAHVGHRAAYWSHPSVRAMGSGLKLYGQRKDGSRFPVEISLSPVKSEDGFRVTAIIRDISEREQVEERLRTIQETYTHQLADTNRELELRNLEIERANRMKSEFLASMSHELRTPLHTVIGFSELLGEEIEGPLNDKQKRFIGHIHKDSLHLLDLINDILDLSKIEAGHLELHREPFDAASAIEEVLSSVRTQCSAQSIQLTTSVSVPAALDADRVRFKQVLYNLLSNAVKFTPQGGKIDVNARVLDGFLEVAVTDTGIGIAKEEHASVFDKFHQVGATTKGVREGTGLGLAISRHLVEQHGGRIRLLSKPGQGSCFTFTVPYSALP